MIRAGRVHARMVRAIVRKDLTEFARDRLWMVLTPLALIVFAAVYWLLPATVDESVTIGVAPPALAAVLDLASLAGDARADSPRIVPFADEASLARAIDDGRPAPDGDRAEPVTIGLAFPADFLLAALTGREPTVRLHVAGSVPPELQGALTAAVREAAFAASGSPLPVTLPAADALVLGPDRSGAQLPLRERMRPLLAFFVLLTESLALASLLAAEVSSRTVAAVLATPARVLDVIVAKGVTGTALAFSQATLLLLVTRSFDANVLPLLAAVALGSVLMAGVALLTGAAGRDFLGTLFLGVGFLIPLTLPAFALLFPGSVSTWIQVLPSHGVVQAIHGAGALGLGFGDLAVPFATGALWSLALFALGGWVLARRVASA
ncbi:MAG: ABC transporter permease [Trueperaceae bacterium]